MLYRASDEGYLTIVILPQGTNQPLDSVREAGGNVLLNKKTSFLWFMLQSLKKSHKALIRA
ncbi:hypothetical protein [Paenibacillus fonticola]|uniref:hypothetical protein n=1 Tax=Paenibacillus fonticola TaxID=379896 RepID=UPI000377726F|nr:hypothetical protein [Paenibacillus fonticola]